MSEWDFLWGLEGQELADAMSTGMTEDDILNLEKQEWYDEWKQLKDLRDSGQITAEEFKLRKKELFPNG